MTSATWAFDLSQQHSEHRTLLPAPRPPPSASPLYEGSMPFDTSLAASTSAGNFRHLDSTQDSASRSHIFDLHGDLLLQRSAALPKDDDGDDQLMPMIAPIDRPLSKASDISPPSNTTQPSSPQPLDPENGSNLYVAGLPSTVDDDTLRSTYAPFGNVISAKVMLSVETSRSRGFGFVLFEKSSHAELAKASLHGKAVPGHGGRMQVSVSKHKGENLAVDSRVAYLRNVPVTVSVDQVVEYCSTFGQRPKVSLRAAKAESTPSLLRAFVVEFQSVEAAKTCVAATHGKMPFGDCTAPVLAKLEEPQALRERRLQSKPASSQSPTGGRTPPASTTPSVSTPGDHSCSTTPTITIGNRTIVMQSASPGTMPAAGTGAATGSPSFASWTPTTAAGSPIPAPPPMPMMGQPQPPFNIHVPPQGAYVNAPLPQALPSSTTSSFVYPSNVGQPQPVPSQAPPSVSYYVVPAPGDHAAAAPPYPHGTAVYVSSATQPGHHQLHHHQQQQHHPLSHHVGAPPPAQHNYPFTAMVGHHGIAPAHGSFAPSQQHLLPTPTAAPPPPHLFPASTLPQALSPSTTSPGYATTAPGGSAALLHPPTYAMPAPPPGLMQQQPQGFNMGGPTQFDIRTLPPQGYYAAPPHHGPM